MFVKRQYSDDQRLTEEPRSAKESSRQSHQPSFEDSTIQNQLFGLFRLKNYKIIKGFIPGKRRLVRLHYTKFQPSSKIGNVCILHGYGQQSNNYYQMADFLASNKFVVHLLDLRGFGYSGGFRIPNDLSELYEDIQQLIKCCQQNLPTFIMTQGLASMLLLSLLTMNRNLPISGVICLTPAFSFPKSDEKEDLVSRLLKWICSQFLGDLLINNSINPTALTKNNEFVKTRIDEGVNYQYVKLSMVKEIQAAKNYIIEKADEFFYPIMILSGRSNSCQSVNDVSDFFKTLASRDKEMHIYENGYHTMYLDDEKQDIKQRILCWTKNRLTKVKFSKVSNMKVELEKKPIFNKKRVLFCIILIISLIKTWRYLLNRK